MPVIKKDWLSKKGIDIQNFAKLFLVRMYIESRYIFGANWSKTYFLVF